jgi:LemA protein
MKGVYVLLGIATVVSFMIVGSYNGMVNKNEGVSTAWSQVENVYQRRSDLIPNIVATVKGAASFEKTTLTAVTQARASVNQMKIDKSIVDNPEMLSKFNNAQGTLGSALGRLMVVVEKYPDLKSNQNFLALQDELSGTENRIAVERKNFNETAMDYNQTIKRFPSNIIAKFFDFKGKAYFQADDKAKTAPKVEF